MVFLSSDYKKGKSVLSQGQDLEAFTEIKKLKILSFQPQYAFSLLLFVINNKG
jgi:hypothetical protein